jgi:three-Cys-motif partner protein
MSANSRHFGRFREQTRLKHFILESYLDRWAPILLQTGGHSNAWFIDAFAGKGQDDQGNPGSPLLACQVAQRLSKIPAIRRLNPTPTLRIVAIEERRSYFRALQQSVSAFISGQDACIEPLYGTLEDHFEAVWNLGEPSDPKLFFLDPFGVKGLSATVIQDSLKRDRHEVLLLFSDAGAHRLHATVKAGSQPRRSSEEGNNLDLFGTTEPDEESGGDITDDSASM